MKLEFMDGLDVFGKVRASGLSNWDAYHLVQQAVAQERRMAILMRANTQLVQEVEAAVEKSLRWEPKAA